MKKIFIGLFVIIALFVVVQISALFNFFPSKSQPNITDQLTGTPLTQTSKTESRPIIGIHYRSIDKQTADQNNIVEGAYITQVISDSPAEKAGLKEEDIITEIDNRIIVGLQEQSVYDLVSALKPGSKVSLKIWRNKEVKNITIALD